MTNTIFPEIHTANVAATSIESGMTTIEPTIDAATGVKSLAYKDEDGNVRKVLTTDSPGGSGGENNTSSSGGTGVGLAMTKDGVDLPIKSLTSDDSTIDIIGDTNEVDLSLADSSVTPAKISATGTPNATTFFRGDGSWSTADSGGSDATSIQSVPVDTAPVGALAHLKTFNSYWYQNFMKQSGDASLSPWTRSACTVNAAGGVIPDAGFQATGLTQTFTVLDGTNQHTTKWKITDGSGIFYYVRVNSATNGTLTAYFNVATGAFTSASAGLTLTSKRNGASAWDICIEQTPVDLACAISLWPCDSSSAPQFTGDGVTVAYTFDSCQAYEGSLADDYPYIETTTVAISKQQLDWVDKDISTEDATALTDGGETDLHSHIVGVDELDATGTPNATTFFRGDGTWSTADSGGSDATSIQSVPVETPLPTEADMQGTALVGQHYRNCLKQSENLDLIWGASAGDTNVGEFIADSTTGQHVVSQTAIVLEPGEHYAHVKFEVGNAPFMVILFYNATISTRFCSIDTATGEITAKSTGIQATASIDGTTITAKMHYDIESVDTQIWLLPASTSNSLNFTGGDGVAVSYELLESQFAPGKINDDLPYIKTTTDIEPGYETFKVQAKTAPKAFLLQRVDDNTWQEKEDGVQFWAPDQHGGQRVIRQYFGAQLNGAPLVAGIANIYGQGGECTDASNVYSTPYGTSAGTRAYLIKTVSTGWLTASIATVTLTWCYADYTLLTPPTTEPTAQWLQ